MTLAFLQFFPASLRLDDLTPDKVEAFPAWLKRQPVFKRHAFSPEAGKAKKAGKRNTPLFEIAAPPPQRAVFPDRRACVQESAEQGHCGS